MISGFQFLLLHLSLALTQLNQRHFNVGSHFRDLSEDAADVVDQSPATRTQLDEFHRSYRGRRRRESGEQEEEE